MLVLVLVLKGDSASSDDALNAVGDLATRDDEVEPNCKLGSSVNSISIPESSSAIL